MTRRLYLSDPYRTGFEAYAIEALTWDGHPAVVLDQTAFYPESGGQPADRGRLGGAEVVDVVEREAGGAVVHVLSQEVSGADGVLKGTVDWRRRFDHMQQHTGQHILSAAMEKALGAGTVGFHLGGSASTIDLDVTGLTMEDVRPAEVLANEVVWDDRRIDIRLTDADGLAELQVEPPPKVDGPIRLLVIPGPSGATEVPYDVNPCGGTHVARSGEIGMIKIVGLERRGDETRVTFLCGQRALHDYQEKDSVLSALTGLLTVGYWELDEAVARLQGENRELLRTERELRQRLLELEAEGLLGTAQVRGRYRAVGRVWQGRSPEELRALARKLADHAGVVALLFSVADQTHFCFSRAEELDLNVNDLLQEACRRLDGKGGGRPQVAQGSGPAAEGSRVEGVLDDLVVMLEGS